MHLEDIQYYHNKSPSSIKTTKIYNDLIKKYVERRRNQMTREELKEQIDELMRQYADEEIDGATYAQKMMELTTSVQNASDED